MLDEEEIEKIKKLINQGKTNYKIGMELGHSANTVKKIREEYKDAKVHHTTEEGTHFDDPIGEVRGIIHNIDNLIKKEHLKAGERKEWEKRAEEIREMLRTEVDDKIARERSNVLEERNNAWNEHIEQNFVQKEVVTDLNNMVKAREATIENRNNAIDQKDGILSSIQQENEGLKNRIRDLLWIKNDLNEKNLQLHYYIENRLDIDLRQGQEKLLSDREALHVEKTNFDRYMEVQRSNLDKLFFEANEKLKTVEIHEEIFNDQEGKLKKREAEFDENRTRMYDTLEESIQALKKREENVAVLEKGLKRWNDEQKDELDAERKKIRYDQEKITQKLKVINKTVEELRTEKHRLQEWQKLLNKTRSFNKFSLPYPHCEKPMLFDANKQETYQKINQTFGNFTHPECRPKSEQQKHVILRPVSLSVEPVIQSGFSPIIQSGLEPIVVECSGEPVVRSGISSIIKSGEELDVFGPIGEPVSQSGVST